MDEIIPTLGSLHELVKIYTTRSSHEKLLIACFSLLEDVCFYFPKERTQVWSCIWKLAMTSCQEQSLQLSVAIAAMQSLTNLASMMSDEFASYNTYLEELLDNSQLRKTDSSTVFVSRRRKERGSYKYCKN